jgi:hypothetical protein
MRTIQADEELTAYLKGRRDEANETLRVLEIVRRLGYLDFDTCGTLIDYLARIDRRPMK